PDPVGRARRALAEDLRLGKEDEPELAPDEAAARRRDRKPKRRIARQSIAIEQLGLDLAEERLGAERIAAVWEGDDDPVPASHERGELVLGLREPARGDRRALCLEGERLPGRERIELGRALERDRFVALVLPGLAHLGVLPDEIRRAGERRHEVAWE